jgi:PTS system galactitol-specific IIA component
VIVGRRDQSLIRLGMDCDTQDQILRELGGLMVEAGLCRGSFPDALCAREGESPTGLDMGGFGIAVPHTDVSHVLSPGLAVGIPLRPVRFTHMGTDGEPVDARAVFCLAIDEPGKHLDFIGALMDALRDRPTLEALAAARTAGEVAGAFRAWEVGA